MVQKDLKMCKNARFNKGPISSRTFKKVQKGPKRFKKVQESSMCLKKDREGSNGFSAEFQIVSLGSSSNLRLEGLRQWRLVIC